MLLLAGCPLFESSERASYQEHAPPPFDPLRDAEKLNAKLQRFIECRDSLSGTLSENWEHYEDQLDARGRPRHGLRSFFVQSLDPNSFRSCTRLLDETQAILPSLPQLESLTRSFFQAASHYAERTRAWNEYLEGRKYREDRGKQAKELHQQLRDAHAHAFDLDFEVVQEIDRLKAQNDPNLLERLAQQKNPLELYARTLMVRSRPMARCFSSLPKAGQCEAVFLAFESAWKDFDAYYQANRERSDRVFWMSTFATDAEEYCGLAKKHFQRIEEKRRNLKAREHLEERYAALLRDANTLDFDFPQ